MNRSVPAGQEPAGQDPVTGRSSGRTLLVDGVLAVCLVVLLVPLSIATGSARLGKPTGFDHPNLVLGVLYLGLVLPLAGRRRWPVASSVAVFAVGLAQLAIGVWWTPADVAVLVSLYSVTMWGPAGAHLVALGAAVTGGLVSATALTLSESRGGGSMIAWVVLAGLMSSAAVAAWAFGMARRARREQLADLRARTETLERDRDQQAALAAAAERARIAREMHDIVAHSLSVIIAQADGGRYASATDPEAGTRSLAVIAETGRAALADMRAILGVLRNGTATSGSGISGTPTSGAGTTRGAGNDGSGAPDTEQPGAPRELAPQPVANDLDTLVQQTRDAGVAVSLVKVGQARTLPAGMGLTLYRICQEALTNVMKHAGPATSVTVLVRWGEQDVVLEVTDDGRGASATGDDAGQGLLGMRERAAMFGGSVSAGPRPGGGFRVKATLPTPRAVRPVAS